MNVGWLIDADMFPGYRDDLVQSVRRQGHSVKIVRVPSPPYRWEDVGCSYQESFPKDACVVAHGDMELVLRIARERRWTPGAYAAIDHFNCSAYYCHFGEHLLNTKYVMLPFGELRRCKEFLLETVGVGGLVFVRPDSPLKLFTGQTISADRYDADLEFLAFYEFPPESLVVVSTPQAIAAEWRFVVVDRAVIAGSLYKLAGESAVEPEYDPAALKLASHIASADFQPERVWVMDICRTDTGDYRLLEIGAFSFADMYACDKDDLVSGVSQAALADWEASAL